MEQNPIVSVVIPVYNTRDYLPVCLNSLKNQTIGADRMEIILVDDGSTDGSAEYLKEFAEHNKNVKLFSLPQNTGDLGHVRNIGVRAAAGEWLYCVDSDDWVGAEALERLVKHAEEWGSDVIQGKMMNVEGAESKGRFSYFSSNKPSIVEGNLKTDKEITATVGPMRLIKMDLLKENGIQFPEGVWYEDAIFIIEVLFSAKCISLANDYEYYFVRRDVDRKGGLSKATSLPSVKRPDRIVTAIGKLFDIIDKNSQDLLEHLLIIKKLFSYQLVQAFINIEAYAELFPEQYIDNGRIFETQMWDRVCRYYTPELRAVLPVGKAIFWDYAQKGIFKETDIAVLPFCNPKPVSQVKLFPDNAASKCKKASAVPDLEVLNADTLERLYTISSKAAIFCITGLEYNADLKLLLKGTYEYPLLITSNPDVCPVLQFGGNFLYAESVNVYEDVWGEPFQGRGRWDAIFCVGAIKGFQEMTVKVGFCFKPDNDNVMVVYSFRDNRFPERNLTVDIPAKLNDSSGNRDNNIKFTLDLGNFVEKESIDEQLIKAQKNVKQSNLEKKNLGIELKRVSRELKAESKKAKAMAEELKAKSKELKAATKELENLKNSKSWKITKPLRVIGKAVHKVLKLKN